MRPHRMGTEPDAMAERPDALLDLGAQHCRRRAHRLRRRFDLDDFRCLTDCRLHVDDLRQDVQRLVRPRVGELADCSCVLSAVAITSFEDDVNDGDPDERGDDGAGHAHDTGMGCHARHPVDSHEHQAAHKSREAGHEEKAGEPSDPPSKSEGHQRRNAGDGDGKHHSRAHLACCSGEDCDERRHAIEHDGLPAETQDPPPVNHD